jgi:hypothetical protein
MGPMKKAIPPYQAGHLGEMASYITNHQNDNRFYFVSQSISPQDRKFGSSLRCRVFGVTALALRNHHWPSIFNFTRCFCIKKTSGTHICNLPLHPLHRQFLSLNLLILKCFCCSGKPLQSRYIVAASEVIVCFMMT